METISCVTFWNNYKDHMTDTEFLKKELAVNKLMEPLGFDIIFSVEHHFSNYSMGPDNFQFLAHMAAITKRIKLGTLGVILPWNDPLRVAERILLRRGRTVGDHIALESKKHEDPPLPRRIRNSYATAKLRQDVELTPAAGSVKVFGWQPAA